MKADLSLYNTIFNIWMFSVHPSREIGVTSPDWWTFNRQLFSCLALKTIPFCCEIVVTLCPSSEVHASIRCIKSDVARTFRSNCRRKALDFLRLYRVGYFRETSVKTLTNPRRHKEYERIILQEMWLASRFTFQCRLSRKPIPVSSISLLFICTLTDFQRDFMRTKLLSMFHMKAISISRHHTEKATLFLAFHFAR